MSGINWKKQIKLNVRGRDVVFVFNKPDALTVISLQTCWQAFADAERLRADLAEEMQKNPAKSIAEAKERQLRRAEASEYYTGLADEFLRNVVDYLVAVEDSNPEVKPPLFEVLTSEEGKTGKAAHLVSWADANPRERLFIARTLFSPLISSFFEALNEAASDEDKKK